MPQIRELPEGSELQSDLPLPAPESLPIAPDATLLRGFARTAPLQDEIDAIAEVAPFRHLTTPGGGRMSVATTNAGQVGWHSDANGYRYVERDPLTDRPWPAMPPAFAELARRAADVAGFAGFAPDCVLVNRYAPGAQMGTHRDHDERDLGHPIVSVSIGLPAVFVWYGPTRRGPPQPVPVVDGDVVVWGGRARGGYHGVRRLRAGADPAAVRYNLTFRRAR
jgi:alkylated DNA repair protein (DNA oxidative demethylase)